ncbi:hypothetical protein EDB81DRAFT_466367 [Dactylonectria macrodidyma]|uniref:Uncharacterized protein n=1 Tax=Dactylonectria macrodidyma TaxID=307937 RepID=A0A9P9EYF5_9HYPO|nr:hypothetical protein EDB81DRAFT_466367 [Dactylonectria macrodidyma]
MAATPFDPSHLAANPFDIYNDAPIIRSPNPILPGGGCNFVDLTPGMNGAKCGCRRFWSRGNVGNVALEQAHWCMCNHHACYHEEGDRDVTFPDVHSVRLLGQENEKPRTGREPLSPVMDLTLKTPPAVPGMDFSSFNGGNLSFINRTPEDTGPFPSIPASPNAGASMPDTLSWGGLIQSQPQATLMPPIPSQCMILSQTASTTSSAQAKYLRPFAGTGLQTLSGVPGPKPLLPHVQDKPPVISSAAAIEGPDVQADSFVFVTQDQDDHDTPRPDTPTQPEPRAARFNAVSRQAFKNLSETVSGHDQRLDRLETVSFAAPGHEECHDKHDHADIRITDLESRIDEVEKLANDANSVVSRRGDEASLVSVSTNNTSRPTHSQELYSQVQSLQAQVIHLQSLMPSSNHPWEVEVVFLPFPLRKVWQEAYEFKTEPLITSDDWTQLPMTHSTTTLRSQSPLYADWTNSGQDSKWLLPKAYSAKSVVDQRLRSRGLIKTVTVKGSDAMSVAIAMNTAFGNVFREMEMFSRPQAPDPRIISFLGLQSAWVPLRKIHKDSRLRFLSPAEMMTHAIWDAQFLNSVMMRSSEPRLFITHPDAYLQDFQAYETGWTWQRLKEMNHISPEAESLQTGAEHEGVWLWNEQLDELPSAHASVTLRNERQQTSSSPSQQYFPAVQTFRSSSPMVARGQSPMLSSRRGSRPPHIRTTSMPMSAPGQNSPATSRRRVASYGQSRRPSPAVHIASQSAITKRRRSTRSPSYHRFTPRWTSSPSPMPFGLTDRQPARGTTPFAYATPYSNAPLQEVRVVRGGSVPRAAPEGASDEDPDFDIEIYESGSEDLYEDNESIVSMEQMAQVEVNLSGGSQRRQLPEDEPWPGIEDQDQLSDGENIDPRDPDHGSNVSSQPSEYPSTQNAWPAADADATGFHIHEDDEHRSQQ